MSKSITGIVAWLKNWFYDSDDVDGFVTTLQNSINTKLNSNLTEANKNLVTNGSGTVVLEDKPIIPDVSGKIDTAGTGLSKSGTTLNHSNSVTEQTSAVAKKIKYDGQGHITGTSALYGSDIAVSSSDSTKINTALSNKANSTHTHSATDVTDSNAHSNIGTSANATQGAINTAIDTAISNLSSIRAIEVVSTLPTASSSTMGKLYIISENSKINVYYTTQSGSTYSWHKMDADILDELVVNWSDVQGRPTKTSDFTNDGADGSHLFVSDNDSRLSDARTPTSHTHGNLTNDGKVGSSSGKIITTTTGGAIQASDSITKSMISDFPTSMTPSSHTHGQVTNDGKITSTAVTVASGDNIVITDASDSSKVKRVANLLVSHIKDSSGEAGKLLVTGSGGTVTATTSGSDYVHDANAHSNLGTSASATQTAINTAIDTKIGTLQGGIITSIALVDKATDSTGKIIFYTGDEPSQVIQMSKQLTGFVAWIRSFLDSIYQEKLESGTNIKTINNNSLLGSGNITIQGGGSVDTWTTINLTNGKLYVNTDLRMCELHYSKSHNLTSANTWTFIETISQIANYPPKTTLYVHGSAREVMARLFDTGSLQANFSAVGQRSITFNLVWHYQEKI